MSTSSTDPKPASGPAPGQINAAVIIFAIFAVFAAFSIWFANVADDAKWGRILVIFSTFEALGFAAAGILLGERVNARTSAELGRTREVNAALESEMRGVRAEAVEVAETTRANVDAALSLLAADATSRSGVESGHDSSARDGAVALLHAAKAKAETLGSRMRPSPDG